MDIVSSIPSSLSAWEPASYSCTLTNLWSGESHPNTYDTIANSAHWSPPVLVSHSEAYTMWAADAVASPGVESVAEAGITGTLLQEIQDAQTEGFAGEFVTGQDQFNAFDGPQTFETIVLAPEFPMMSTITMVAPSPDWFSGIPAFSAVDTSAGVWYESFAIETYPWDAGTETGNAYSLNNNPEDPPLPITRITAEAFPDSILVNTQDPSQPTIRPMASWSCVLQPAAAPEDPPVAEDPPTEEENEVVSEDPPQEIEIVVEVENDAPPPSQEQNITDVVDEEEEEEPVGEEPEPQACLRYFGRCVENLECCSGSCSRGFCTGRSRGNGRDESFRLSNQGGSIVGGEASRRRRSGRRGGRRLVPVVDDLEEVFLRGSE